MLERTSVRTGRRFLVGAGLCAAAIAGWIAFRPDPAQLIRVAEAPRSTVDPGDPNAPKPIGIDELFRSRSESLTFTSSGRTLPVTTVLRPTASEQLKGAEAALTAIGITHQWPDIYATAQFEGESLIAAFDDDANRYRIVFDGAVDHLIDRPGKQLLRFGHIGRGHHTVRLEKTSESLGGAGTFVGFFVPEGGKVLDPPGSRPRQMEFIGDSDMVGYGNTSTSRDCTTEELFSATDTQKSYGPRVARHFDADYQVNASSGIGVVRNYAGAAPDVSMVSLYPRVLFDDPSPYDSRGWKPQIIVLALGANDFVTELEPGERWPDRDALRADFESRYAQFILSLTAKNPDAFILMAAQEGYHADYRSAHRTVLENLRAAEGMRVDLVSFPKLELTGCDWHPSMEDHDAMAGILVDYIEARPELWQGR